MGARTLPSTTRRNAGSGCSRSGGSGEGPNSDALLTSKSNRPARRAAAAIARRSLGRATSPGTPVTMAPAALRRSVAAPNAFSWRAVRMRVHRCRARNSARVYPRPRLAPVIRATCSTEARFGDAARSAIEELSMADTGLPRFISLLVYKLYKPNGSRRMQLNGLRGQLYAASDVLPNDARQRWRGSRPTRRTSPKGASIPHALRPCFVSRLAGARPRAPRPDAADDPGDVREGASGPNGVRGEPARRGALVRRGLGGESARHHGPRSIREDPRWNLVVARGPLGRRGDGMGSERRASLRPNREDGRSGPPSLLGSPAMDALDEYLAPTRIDLRDARPRLRGRVGQAVTSPGETPPRPGVLGPTRGWHMAAGMLEARPTRTEAFLRKHIRGLPRVVITVA